MAEQVAPKTIGNRKFKLGVMFLVMNFALLMTCIITKVGYEVTAAVAGSILTQSAGLAAIVWGNVQEHRAKNGTS